MDLSWPEDSLDPFLSNSPTPASIKNQYNVKYQNPLKIDINQNSSTFKPIPLPDDIIGFDPGLNMNMNMNLGPGMGMGMSLDIDGNLPLTQLDNNENMSFNFENYLKDDINDLDNDYLDAHLMKPQQQQESNEDDIEKVLLDLGISEAPSHDPHHTHCDHSSKQPQRGHKRQLSGSGIFGFVGVGENTQLSIPGVEPVQFYEKKPLYKEDDIYSNLNLDDISTTEFLNNLNSTSLLNGNDRNNVDNTLFPKKSDNIQNSQTTNPLSLSHAPLKPNLKENPDYYVPSGNQRSYKFPPSPPKGTFNSNASSNLNPFVTNQIKVENNVNPDLTIKLPPSEFTSPKTNKLSSPLQISPIQSFAQSSPIKNINLQTPRTSLSPNKNLMQALISSQSKFKIKSLKGLSTNVNDNETTILADINDDDKTISAMATPSKKINFSNDALVTPTKKKSQLPQPTHLTGSPKLELLRQQNVLKCSKRPIVRKKPTIKSTLEAGTLDKYFEGPDEEGKFTCKFFEEDIQCFCNRKFTRISNTRAHIQTHLSDRPFVCDVCGKGFVRNHDLGRHKKGHSGPQNICPCGKKFPRIDALKRHRQRNICIGGIDREGVTKPENKNTKTNSKKLNDHSRTQKLLSNLNDDLKNNLDSKNHKNVQIPENPDQQYHGIVTPPHQQVPPPQPPLGQPMGLFSENNEKNVDLMSLNQISVVQDSFFNLNENLEI